MIKKLRINRVIIGITVVFTHFHFMNFFEIGRPIFVTSTGTNNYFMLDSTVNGYNAEGCMG